MLNCGKCGPAEGIFVGDVTKPDTLVGAVKGVDSVAIAVGTTGRASEEVTKNVEWLGVINQVSLPRAREDRACGPVVFLGQCHVMTLC